MKYLFDGDWTFREYPLGTGYETAAAGGDFRPVAVPHDWLIGDSTDLYRDGSGWYRKEFEVSAADADGTHHLFLTFDGVYMDSTVYVNGQEAFAWKYGYSSFTFEITPYVKAGSNIVMVRVEHQSPNSRWYSGAGIYRHVWLSVREADYIPENGIYVHTDWSGDLATVQIETQVCGAHTEGDSQHILPSRIRTVLTDAATGTTYTGNAVPDGVKTKGATPVDGGLIFLQQLQVEAPHRWNLDDPFLYDLCVQLMNEAGNEVLQEEHLRIGLREVLWDTERGFVLNGKNIKLNGVCEHHDLGPLGAAFEISGFERKLRVLRGMGVNAIRCTHNMTAPEVEQLADELGFVLISEAFDMWERSKTEYDYGRFFKEWHARDVRSWVTRDRNHASVILWSIGNEIYDTHADAHGVEITRDLKQLVETYDPAGNARATIGSNYMPWEGAQHCADELKLAGYNYAERFYEQHHKEHPDWLIYGSETSSIGYSRGIYHFPLSTDILSDDDEQCSSLGNSMTSWGARSIEDCNCDDRDVPFSAGQFLWSGFDYFGEPTPYKTRSSYFGQIDTAGFPKDPYYVWKGAWTSWKDSPFVHIFPYWSFNEGQNIDVRVVSNAPEVELFLDGESLGRQKLDILPGSGRHTIADYQILYRPGTLTAVCYAPDGTELARQERSSFGDAAALQLSVEKNMLRADGYDLAFLTISAVDDQGLPVETAADRVHVHVEGAGVLVGLDNGDSTDADSVKGLSKRLFSGKLLAVVQSNGQEGDVSIKVSAKGLKEAGLTLTAVREVSESLKEEYASYRIWNPVRYGTEQHLQDASARQPVLLGKEDEIPVRAVRMKARGPQVLTAQQPEVLVDVCTLPAAAEDQSLEYRIVNESGVPSPLAELEAEDGSAVPAHTGTIRVRAKGDGNFILRAMSRSGSGKVRLISQLEFRAEGLGEIYLNPYEFVYGSLFTDSEGEMSAGNEKGISTGRTDRTAFGFRNVDFGRTGSDTLTLPIFTLNDDPYEITIYKGMPADPDAECLGTYIYQKHSIWNTYQEETFTLPKRLQGLCTISFETKEKMHIKGFSFRKEGPVGVKIPALTADTLYGDSFRKTEDAIEGIGNNTTLSFTGLDFGDCAAHRITIEGRAANGSNTIHCRVRKGDEETLEVLEFAESGVYTEQTFDIAPVEGNVDVNFIFLPGSSFDFRNFMFG